jgi:hypothetical protein
MSSAGTLKRKVVILGSPSVGESQRIMEEASRVLTDP